MAEKPRNKPAGKPPGPEVKDDEPGRLGTDDRGNVQWQWSEDDADLLADDDVGKIERIRALSDTELGFEDEASGNPANPHQADPKKLKSGYNPYNSGAIGKETWKKKKDLRELSKWIELRKKMAKKKPDED